MKKNYFFIFNVLLILIIKVKIICSPDLINSEISERPSYQNNLLHSENMERIENILQIKKISKQYKTVNNIEKMFFDLCEQYFGIKVNNYKSDQKLIEDLVFAINKFNQLVSDDLKYLCDMKIKYILQNEKIIIEKISKNSIYDLLTISFLFYTLLPNEYINETGIENTDEFIERESNWHEASLNLNLEFSELGLLNKSFLYKQFDEIIMQNLIKSKIYNDFIIIKKDVLDPIEKNKYVINTIQNKYIQYINSHFKDTKESIECYEEKLDFLGEWLFDKQNVLNSIEKILQEDFLFFLVTLVQLSHSVEKLHEQYYQDITDSEYTQLKKSSDLAELIIKKFLSLCEVKNKINFDILPSIVISSNRLKNIINYIKNINLIG